MVTKPRIYRALLLRAQGLFLLCMLLALEVQAEGQDPGGSVTGAGLRSHSKWQSQDLSFRVGIALGLVTRFLGCHRGTRWPTSSKPVGEDPCLLARLGRGVTAR